MNDDFSLNNKAHNRGWVLAALMFSIMLAAMDVTIVSTAIPQIVADLGDFGLFSWVYSIYLLAQTITIPIYGKLADIYGRKPVLRIGIVVFLAGSAASAASWDMTSLIIFRGLQGLGAGAIMATVNTIAGDIYTVRERAQIQGWLSSVWGMAAIMGPSLGGALVEYANWRWIFLINIPIGITAFILLSVFFKEHIVKREHHIDYGGALMMLVTGTILIFTLMKLGQEWELFTWRSSGMILLTILLITLTIYIEKRSREPVMPNWVWTNKILAGSNLAMILMGAMMLGPNMYIPVFAQSVLGMGAIAAGFILASMTIGWPVASSLSGKLYLKIGFRNTAVIGVIMIIIFSTLFLTLPFNMHPWWLVADQLFLGAGFGLLSTPVLVGVQSVVSWGKRGVVTSANMFSRYLGQSIGAAVLGGVFNTAINGKLSNAPAGLKQQMPRNVNDVITVLQSSKTSESASGYIKHAFYYASHQVYFTMALIGVLTFACLFLLSREYHPVAETE